MNDLIVSTYDPHLEFGFFLLIWLLDYFGFCSLTFQIFLDFQGGLVNDLVVSTSGPHLAFLAMPHHLTLCLLYTWQALSQFVCLCICVFVYLCIWIWIFVCIWLTQPISKFLHLCIWVYLAFLAMPPQTLPFACKAQIQYLATTWAASPSELLVVNGVTVIR